MMDESIPKNPADSDSRLERWERWHSLGRPYFAWQFEYFRPFIGKRVADIGCGAGNITPLLLDREIYYGIDASARLINMLRSEFVNHENIKAEVASAADPQLAQMLMVERIDTILCIGLLEHVLDDSQVVTNLISALPRSGILGLLVPAHPVLFGKLDVADGHFRRYTRSRLESLLLQDSMKILSIRYFNFAGALVWLWRGKFLRSGSVGESTYSTMNNFIPVLKSLERLISPPAGVSLIAVAQKI